MTEIITSQAPGRICLFGDHQDYLQLPIIACAVDRRLYVKAIPNGTNQHISKGRSIANISASQNLAKLEFEDSELMQLLMEQISC